MTKSKIENGIPIPPCHFGLILGRSQNFAHLAKHICRSKMIVLFGSSSTCMYLFTLANFQKPAVDFLKFFYHVIVIYLWKVLMGISAVDELLVQQIFEKKPKPRLPWVPFWVHEIVLLIVSWLGLFHLDDPKMLVITLEKFCD